uniref:Uncharacterized protein n=1 Tax=Leersia perrieri TaxID=77586 RepID=A0A0D9V500_9ORYZ
MVVSKDNHAVMAVTYAIAGFNVGVLVLWAYLIGKYGRQECHLPVSNNSSPGGKIAPLLQRSVSYTTQLRINILSL